MRQIGFDKNFSLLAQEAHLAKNTLLSGLDLLLKANFFQDKDGYFYSAFFHISIGMERILKLAVVTNHMLSNNYQVPTKKQLKKISHNIRELDDKALEMMPLYRHPNASSPIRTDNDKALIDFFTEYGSESRYFNLDEVCEAKMDRSPLDKWLDLSISIYEEYTSPKIRQKSELNLMYKMDRNGIVNGFTDHLNEEGNPLMVFDCFHRQYMIQKSTPLVIWRLIEVLRPMYFLLEAMANKATDYETENKINSMVIPHYEDFFYFLLAEKSTIKRRKKWLEIFNS